MQQRYLSALCVGGVLALASGVATRAQPAPQTYKGLEVQVAGIERATNVSLSDCPPGANTQRGVIKPGDTTEFAAVKVDFTHTWITPVGDMVDGGENLHLVKTNYMRIE